MSLARSYRPTSQRHLTVTAIRDRMGWSDPNCRGFWQDLRDSAQDFRLRHFPDTKWGDIDDTEKNQLCTRFTQGSRHRALIEREEEKEDSQFISWWLLANTRAVNPSPDRARTTQVTSQVAAVTTRGYYDPVRG